MAYVQLVFRLHVIQRMFERGITVDEVRTGLEQGEIIEKYPDDEPYPSHLVLASISNRPIHIVVAHNEKDKQTIVITVYEPDPRLWDSEFRRRKK